MNIFDIFKFKPKYNFRQVDWLEIEGRLRGLETQLKNDNQADKKQTIIQADSLVDSITKQAGIRGATFGERLKTLREKLPKSVYHNLWAAHIKRNELVHDTGSFVVDWELRKHFQSFKDAISHLRGLR